MPTKKNATQNFQPIYDMAEICAQHGVTHAVLCPGSRCAPLTLAFARTPKIKTWTVCDERSAAFIACGLSLHADTPTALVCTSGSAPYHFAPAIAESFFRYIPLIVFTADRPREWIDQWDGQTLRQRNIYGDQVKKSYELPQEYNHPDSVWHINRVINEAMNLSRQSPKGPVHINVPLREPLYEAESICCTKSVRIIKEKTTVHQLARKEVLVLQEQLMKSKKVLLIVGQHRYNKTITDRLDRFAKLHHIPVLADVTSNQHGLSQRITHADVFLEHGNTNMKKRLHPELLITCGTSILSKSTKQFIRQYRPKQHWHIQGNGVVADPYQGLTHIIPTPIVSFLRQLSTKLSPQAVQTARKRYLQCWKTENRPIQRALHAFFKVPIDQSEFHLVNAVMKTLPPTCSLHLANSLPVRYANRIGLPYNCNVQVLSNRGVSGIDGCSSTAVGYALASQKLTVLITGDIAFFHDRNAFWHGYPLPNLRIIVLNNHGGGIFSVIKGPGKLPELDPYFIANQHLTAESTAREFGFNYIRVNTLKGIKAILSDFYALDGTTKLLEIESNRKVVQKTWNEFTSHIKANYGTELRLEAR